MNSSCMRLHCLVLIAMLLATATPSFAKRRSHRQGSISQALLGSNDPAQSPFTKAPPLKVASIDKLSNQFDEKHPKDFEEINLVQPKHPGILPGVSADVPVVPPTPPKNKTGRINQADYQLPREFQEEKARAALKGVEDRPEEDEKIELQFEDASLDNFVQEMAELFNITFIADENIDPLPKGTADDPAKAIKGNKITFKTNKPLSRKDAWDLFITFLDIAGFAVVPQADPAIYRIQTIKSAQRTPVPTYLGVNPDTLPDNDQMIRYLYFIENATVEAMKAVIPSLQSASAGSPIFLLEHKAFLLVDKAYNIKSLMKIVKELDKVTMPQAMSVLKLRQVDADDVRKLYEELTQTGEDKSPFRPWGGARKQPTAIYFPENARLIAEPRTNSLILLGPKDALEKIEEFIVKYIDVDLDQPYSPLFTIQLQYADSKVVSEIMNSTTKFGQNTEAGKSGGVRGRDKYLRQMTFTPEPATNKIIVRGDYEDFLLAKQIIEQLDAPQPQIALDVLIVSLTMMDAKEVGSQLRSKVNSIPGLAGLLGQNVVFQTSGMRAGQNPQGIVTNNTGPGFDRLLGNLLKLVTQAPAGNTIVTFGQDLFGVWGLFQVLRTITNTQVISNPFLIAAHKTPARVSLGETRRVQSSTVVAQQNVEGFADDEAKLQVDITPQINSDGMIVLSVEVNLTEFTEANPSSGNKNTKYIKTQAIVADKEVLALGGLIREKTSEDQSKTPILGDVPVLGWLFKNQSKTKEKQNLLILISAKIIPPHSTTEINDFTQEHLKKYQLGFEELFTKSDGRDPIFKSFFTDSKADKEIENTLFARHNKNNRRKRKKKKQDDDPLAQQEISLVNNQKTPIAPAPIPVVTQPSFITIAAPTIIAQATEKPPVPSSALKDRKRSSRSLSNFLSTNETEKRV